MLSTQPVKSKVVSHPYKWSLVDCNSFFASCELVFRPDLHNRPVVVLSSNDGCIIAANKRAKDLGIKMFGPYFEAKQLLDFNKAAVFSSNFSLYADMSRRVNEALAEFSPEVEIYSIDECFLNILGLPWDKKIEDLGHCMKNKVFQYTGLGVGVGMGPTKVLAKLANYLAKHDASLNGVCAIDPKASNFHSLLESVVIEKVWGVGKKSSAKLRALGIRNALEFCQYANERLILKTLTKTGAMIQQELRGIECLDSSIQDAKKKQIMCSRSFENPKITIEQLQEILANFSMEVSEKLRKQRSVCSLIMVYIRTSPFSSGPQYFNQSFYSFDTPTKDTRKICRAAFHVLSKLYREGFDYKKAGILLCDITDEDSYQPSLFDQGDTQTSQQLMTIMDQINESEGRQTIRLAACGTDVAANLVKKNYRSPAYTTRWSELPQV
jgi:DNA polymerase V